MKMMKFLVMMVEMLLREQAWMVWLPMTSSGASWVSTAASWYSLPVPVAAQGRAAQPVSPPPPHF